MWAKIDRIALAVFLCAAAAWVIKNGASTESPTLAEVDAATAEGGLAAMAKEAAAESREAVKSTIEPCEAARQDNARLLVVRLSISASADNPPVIRGETYLPDGTQLGVLMQGERGTGCSPNCLFTYKGPTVKDGRFSTVPYEYDSNGILHTTSKKAMLGMPYTVYVGSMGPQPPDVENVIGYFGTNLRGPLVTEWPGTIPGFQVQVRRRITIGVRAD